MRIDSFCLEVLGRTLGFGKITPQNPKSLHFEITFLLTLHFSASYFTGSDPRLPPTTGFFCNSQLPDTIIKISVYPHSHPSSISITIFLCICTFFSNKMQKKFRKPFPVCGIYSSSVYHLDTNSSVFSRESMRALCPPSLFLPLSPLKNLIWGSSMGTNMCPP